MIDDLTNLETGQELEDPAELLDELKNMVYLSDHSQDEKERLHDLFNTPLSMDEIKGWKKYLIVRQKGELTRVRNGELLLQAELKRAVMQAVKLDNT